MPNSENNQQSPFDTRPGAVAHITYMERTMKGYCVFESDLKLLTFLNTWATVLFSCGSFSLAVVVSILTNWVMQTQSNELSKISILLIVIFGIIALLCYGLGTWMTIKQKTHWKEIGSQSNEHTKVKDKQ